MLKLLFKYVMPLAVMLTVGLVGYNLFFGTPAEQENSRQIIAKVRGLGSDVFSLLRSEKAKFSDGKYDQAVDKIGSSLSYLKQKVGTFSDRGQAYLGQINALEQEKNQLQQQLQQLRQNGESANYGTDAYGNPMARSGYQTLSIDEINARLGDLARHTEDLGMRIGAQ